MRDSEELWFWAIFVSGPERGKNMSSKSRATQEKLVGLEKASAPFEDQLVEAAKFVGVDLSEIGASQSNCNGVDKVAKALTIVGKAEWLLRWLLKKLQAPKDAVPRNTAGSWRLFTYIVQTLPVEKTARILTEKKFTVLLRRTLEEAHKGDGAGKELAEGTPTVDVTSSEIVSSRKSKKRRRSGEVITTTSGDTQPFLSLLLEISATITTLVKYTSGGSSSGNDAGFSAELMKTALRTTGEESAKILGLWLSLSPTVLAHDENITRVWLSPFIKIWELRSIGDEDLMHFSLHCTPNLLQVLGQVKKRGDEYAHWKSELELLAAQNILLPAKKSLAQSPESDILSILTRLSVIQDSDNASLLFDVAIISLPPKTTPRRRLEDSSWIQTVFTTLKDAMPSQRTELNGRAIQAMLESALEHSVEYELPLLYSILTDYAILSNSTNWKLLSTIIKLDGNSFLIPDEKKNHLQELLNRITAACVDLSWEVVSDQVVFDVVVPLMREFAKARDFSGFIRHWYAQLVAYEALHDSQSVKDSAFSAWEDEGLQTELKSLLTSALTINQIKEIVEWLATEVTQNPNAVCVILEAMAGAIPWDETAITDAISLSLYHVMFDSGLQENLTERFKWRSWRLLSRCFAWLNRTELEELSNIWDEKPFSSLKNRSHEGGLLQTAEDQNTALETLEMMNFGCVALQVAPYESAMKAGAKEYVKYALQQMIQDTKIFLKSLRGSEDLGNEICGRAQNNLHRGMGWNIWALVQCIFVHNPSVVHVATELSNDGCGELLKNIFLIASATPDSVASNGTNSWLQNNKDAISTLWSSFVGNDITQNNEELIDVMIDMLLSCQTNDKHPLIRSRENNALAVQSLLDLPLEIMNIKQRERIMKSWLPESTKSAKKGPTYESTALDALVLNLKIRMMDRPTFYEGLKYQELLSLAEVLANSTIPDLPINLELFGVLASQILEQMTEHLDRSRNRAYALEAIQHLKLEIEKKSLETSKSRDKWDFASIVLFATTLKSFLDSRKQMSTLDILSEADLISMIEAFKSSIFSQLRSVLRKPKKIKGEHKSLLVLPIIDALTTLGFDENKAASLAEDANTVIASLSDTERDREMVVRIADFLDMQARDEDGERMPIEIKGDITTFVGRESIRKRAQIAVEGKDNDDKLEVLQSLWEKFMASQSRTDLLLAIRTVIGLCRDVRSDEDDNADIFDLSSLYSQMSNMMWKTSDYRQFAIISETLEMMLLTKGRAISQYNIDSTLLSISIMCSYKAPPIRQSQAGHVYMHLCHLFQTILTSHRLKIQGHFHVVVQSLQALLHCLFTPYAHSSSNTRLFTTPPWLPTAPELQLKARQAAAFTRLLTLICDPSTSSVTHSQHNSLVSATDKAKRMAGQHMQFVLMMYIKLRVEMNSLPAVREELTPGLYAIFDTTTQDLREKINDGLDSNGRALFRDIYANYRKFGKWKGS